MNPTPRKAGLITRYKMLLSDGSRVAIESTSAGQAIEEAIWLHRGRTVKQCYAGMTDQEAREFNASINLRTYANPADKPSPALAGIVDFTPDIEPHEAIAADAVRPKPRAKKDMTEPLFSEDDDKRIKIESRSAGYRRKYGAGSSTFS